MDPELLLDLLEPLGEGAGFEIELSPSLPAVDQVRENLLWAFGE